MTQVLIFCLSVRLKLFNVGSQNAHLLIEVIRKVKIIELAEAQLVVIVVKRFFGDADGSGSLGEAHFFHAGFRAG